MWSSSKVDKFRTRLKISKEINHCNTITTLYLSWFYSSWTITYCGYKHVGNLSIEISYRLMLKTVEQPHQNKWNLIGAVHLCSHRVRRHGTTNQLALSLATWRVRRPRFRLSVEKSRRRNQAVLTHLLFKCRRKIFTTIQIGTTSTGQAYSRWATWRF